MDDPTIDARFLEFLSYYPRREAKRDALKAWGQMKVTDDEWVAILAALDWQVRSEQWQKDGGAYVPLPATYLRGRRWEDEQPRPIAAGRRDIPHAQHWTCPHEPKHCSRWACERQAAIDEAAS